MKKSKTKELEVRKNLPITFRYGPYVYTADSIEFTKMFIRFFEDGDPRPFTFEKIAALDFEDDIEHYDDAEYCLNKCLAFIDDTQPEKKNLKRKIAKLIKERLQF